MLSTWRKNRRVCNDCYEKTSLRFLKNNLYNKPSINQKNDILKIHKNIYLHMHSATAWVYPKQNNINIRHNKIKYCVHLYLSIVGF